MKTFFRTALLGFTLALVSGGAAIAGCDSSCPKGKCRYDAATGHYCDSGSSFQSNSNRKGMLLSKLKDSGQIKIQGPSSRPIGY